MSQVTTPTEPGWLPDPSGRYEWRYWDGGWTNRVANTAPDEAAPAPADVVPRTVAPAPAPAAPAAFAPAPAAVDAAPIAPVPAPPPIVAPLPAPTPAPDPEPSPAPTARDAVPRVPFGTDPEPGTEAAVAAPPTKRRRAPWVVVVDFFRSFSNQPESYHSQLARATAAARSSG